MLYPEATQPVEYNYNDLGQLVKIPGFITSITYDRGLPQTVRYANGVTLSYTYDRNVWTCGRTPMVALSFSHWI